MEQSIKNLIGTLGNKLDKVSNNLKKLVQHFSGLEELYLQTIIQSIYEQSCSHPYHIPIYSALISMLNESHSIAENMIQYCLKKLEENWNAGLLIPCKYILHFLSELCKLNLISSEEFTNLFLFCCEHCTDSHFMQQCLVWCSESVNETVLSKLNMKKPAPQSVPLLQIQQVTPSKKQYYLKLNNHISHLKTPPIHPYNTLTKVLDYCCTNAQDEYIIQLCHDTMIQSNSLLDCVQEFKNSIIPLLRTNMKLLEQILLYNACLEKPYSVRQGMFFVLLHEQLFSTPPLALTCLTPLQQWKWNQFFSQQQQQSMDYSLSQLLQQNQYELLWSDYLYQIMIPAMLAEDRIEFYETIDSVYDTLSSEMKQVIESICKISIKFYDPIPKIQNTTWKQQVQNIQEEYSQYLSIYDWDHSNLEITLYNKLHK